MDNDIEKMRVELQNAIQQRDKERYDKIKESLDLINKGIEQTVDLSQTQNKVSEDNHENMSELQSNVVDMFSS